MPNHLTLSQLDSVFCPLPPIVLNIMAFSAISGAYLYVVSSLIQGSRARSLTPSDLLWSSARLVIAVPMGLSLALLASESLGPFVAFALGAFPLEEINRIIRRVVNSEVAWGIWTVG
jgi:hypothetical protein